jgi:hypothetical protein
MQSSANAMLNAATATLANVHYPPAIVAQQINFSLLIALCLLSLYRWVVQARRR